MKTSGPPVPTGLGLRSRWRWQAWRRRLKAALPWVRRREYDRLQARYEALAQSVLTGLSPARDARLQALIRPELRKAQPVCLFVAYARDTHLRVGVLEHLQHLQAAGYANVLIVNSDEPGLTLEIGPALRDVVAGVFVRDNRGYDFAAWSHGLSTLGLRTANHAVLLVNDSIVPVGNAASFRALFDRLGATTTDMTGLTECASPRTHLQSYFLHLTPRALAHEGTQKFFDAVVNWPDKQQVVALYETRLTQRLTDLGLTSAALYGAEAGFAKDVDLTDHAWQSLLDAGMPYLKRRVLDSLPPAEREAWLARMRAGCAQDPAPV